MNLRNPLHALNSLQRLLVAVLLGVSLHAENWQAFTTRAPAARVGHGFELRLDGVPVAGAVSALGLHSLWVVGDGQSSGALSAHLSIAIDQDATAGAWSLVDTTTGDVAALPLVYYNPVVNPGGNPDGGFGARDFVEESTFVAPAGVPPRRYFLVPEGRVGHPFSLCQPGGVAYPLTVRADVPLGYYDSSAAGYLTAFEASATLDPTKPFWIVDMLTYERTENGATDLTSANWVYDPSSIPMVGVTVIIEGRELGHRFKVYSRAGDGPVISASAVAGLAADAGWNGYTYDHSWNVMDLPTGTAALTFSVGVGMEFWITRDADGISTAPWIAETFSGGPMLWSALGAFPDPPQRAMPLEPVTFRIQAGRWGHDFSVRMSDGYRSRFSVTHTPMDMNDTESWGSYEMGAISSWDDQGLYNPLAVLTFTSSIDPARTWWLRDDSTGESFNLGQTDVLDGWVPLHEAPPLNYNIGIQLPAWRVGSPFKLMDEQFGEVGFSDPSTERSLNTDTFSGLDGMADFTLQSFTLSFTHPQAYSTSALALQDVTDASNPVAWQVTRGSNDLRWLLQPTQPLTFAISSSRWDHELILRQPNGDAYPVQKYSTQSGTWFDPAGNAWQQSYYYFDASADHRSDFPWYVEDLSTSERIGPWPSAEALINWIAVSEPIPYDIALIPGTSTVKFRWTAGPNTSEGGSFVLEQQSPIADNWVELDSVYVATPEMAAADYLHSYEDQCAGFFEGSTVRYRVRYDYGGRRSKFSNPLATQIPTDADLDGIPDANDPDKDDDGIPDALELAWGLDPTDPFDALRDSDGDGTNNRDEILAGTDPFDPFNGQVPTIQIVSGDNQHVYPSHVAPQPVKIRCIAPDGSLMGRLMVQVTAPSDGQVHLTRGQAMHVGLPELEYPIDRMGEMQFWVLAPSGDGTHTITIKCGTSVKTVTLVTDKSLSPGSVTNLHVVHDAETDQKWLAWDLPLTTLPSDTFLEVFVSFDGTTWQRESILPASATESPITKAYPPDTVTYRVDMVKSDLL